MLLITPVVVLYCLARAKIEAIPMPELKSGVIAASVTMNSWRFFLKSLHCEMI